MMMKGTISRLLAVFTILVGLGIIAMHVYYSAVPSEYDPPKPSDFIFPIILIVFGLVWMSRDATMKMYGIRAWGVLALAVGSVVIVFVAWSQVFPHENSQTHWTQLILGIGIFVAGLDWVTYKGIGIEKVAPPEFESVEMQNARRKAQDSLPVFLDRLREGVDDSYIQFPHVDKKGTEHHPWAVVRFHREEKFFVNLPGEPVNPATGEEQLVAVEENEVEDWTILEDDGTISGAYSRIALFDWWQAQGNWLTPLMKQQRADLRDAER